MDEEIELTTVDGQTVRVALSIAARAVGGAIQGCAYSVAGSDGERIEVRRVREDDVVPPEIEEDAAAVAAAVDVAVTRALDRRARAQSELHGDALTPTRLDEFDEMARAAQERAAKATAWPWGHKAGVLKHYCFSLDAREDFGFSQQELHWEDGHEVPAEANCVFVAHAREDVPVLAAAVLALSAEVRRLRGEP